MLNSPRRARAAKPGPPEPEPRPRAKIVIRDLGSGRNAGIPVSQHQTTMRLTVNDRRRLRELADQRSLATGTKLSMTAMIRILIHEACAGKGIE